MNKIRISEIETIEKANKFESWITVTEVKMLLEIQQRSE